MNLLISLFSSNSLIQSGIAFSFDDSQRIQTWVDYHNNYGAAKGWKASFAPEFTDTSSLVTGIQTLSSYGHEIINHSYSHFYDIDTYMLTHTGQEYYEEHVQPAETWMISIGLPQPNTYAWPNGFENDECANYILTQNYNICRGINIEGPATPLSNDTSIHAQGNQRTIGLTMDSHWVWWVEQDYYDLLEYARDNNRVVEFFGHNIQNPEGGTKNVPIAFMNNILDYVNDNGMKFYTYRELADL